jgi:hypothetical protein
MSTAPIRNRKVVEGNISANKYEGDMLTRWYKMEAETEERERERQKEPELCPVCREEPDQPVKFGPCEHIVCLGCAENVRLHGFKRPVHVRRVAYKFDVSIRCPVCRTEGERFSLPFKVGGPFRHMQCPFCQTDCSNDEAVTKHVVRCSKRYPECYLCETKLSTIDEPPNGDMDNALNNHVKRGRCNGVRCTDCWRQGTWQQISHCRMKHRAFNEFRKSFHTFCDKVKPLIQNDANAKRTIRHLSETMGHTSRGLFVRTMPQEIKEEIGEDDQINEPHIRSIRFQLGPSEPEVFSREFTGNSFLDMIRALQSDENNAQAAQSPFRFNF